MKYKNELDNFIDLMMKPPIYGPVQASLDKVTAECAQVLVGVEVWVAPHAMICGPPDSDGKAPWQPVPSPIDDEMLAAYERFIGKSLPHLFREYISYKCLLNVDFYVGNLPWIDPRRPLGWLEWYAIRSRSYKETPWLIPFTPGPAIAGELCFDTSRRDPEGDCPIVYFASVEDDERELGDDSLGHTVFGSFREYFDFLESRLVFVLSGAQMDFSDWLKQHGKPVPPPQYYR